MKTLYDDWEMWERLMTLLEHQFGSRSEFILHDLTKDYNHTIVDIRNGHITNRRVGDSGTNLGLEVLRGTVEKGDRYNYVVHTPDGKLLRSSTMYLTDDRDNIIGSLCINTDITETVQCEAFLRQYNQYNIPENGAASGAEVAGENRLPQSSSLQHQTEFFANDVESLLDFLLDQARNLIAKPVEKMTREDKIKFIGYLDQKGALLITKSSERIYEYLNISRFTFYNYLEAARREASAAGPAEEGQEEKTINE